jgi:hypothetical protein
MEKAAGIDRVSSLPDEEVLPVGPFIRLISKQQPVSQLSYIGQIRFKPAEDLISQEGKHDEDKNNDSEAPL